MISITPVILLVDSAVSTQKTFRQMLNMNMPRLLEAMEYTSKDQVLRLLTIHYNERQDIITNFLSTGDIHPDALTIRSDGTGLADTGRALIFALDKTADQTRSWLQQGHSVTPPICLLLTDGRPSAEHPPQDLQQSYAQAGEKLRRLIQDQKISFAAAACSHLRFIQAERKPLEQLCGDPECVFDIRERPEFIPTREEGFNKLVTWLSQAIRNPGPVINPSADADEAAAPESTRRRDPVAPPAPPKRTDNPIEEYLFL